MLFHVYVLPSIFCRPRSEPYPRPNSAPQNKEFILLPTRLSLILACTFAAAQTGNAFAQTSTPPRIGIERFIPRLVVADAKIPIKLERVEVEADIVGQTARTRIELEFRNPNDRVLEGELQFPLLDGQSITGFALDMNGQMRPAVPVEKAKGRQVFEDVTRARVDPALLEVTQGNNYKLRVYPLPAQGTRRVMLEISETLAPAAKKTKPGEEAALTGGGVYRLPLQFADKVNQLSLSLRIAGVSPEKLHLGKSAQGAAVGKDEEGNAWVNLKRKDFNAQGLFEVALPVSAAPMTVTGRYRNQDYFYAELPLAALGKMQELASAPRPAPHKVALLWDASGSGANRDHGREFALLDAWIKSLGNVEIELVVGRDKAEAPRHFTIKNGDWRDLRKQLESLAYDGATDLSALTAPAGCDLALLFSDGLSNFGSQALPAFSMPLYTVNAAVSADDTALRAAAEKTGGRLLNLISDSTEQALKALRTRDVYLSGLTSNGAKQLVSASPYPDAGRIAIAGVLSEPQATVELEFTTPQGKRISRSITVKAGGGESGEAPPLAAQRWAGLTLAKLEADYEKNRSAIKRVGTDFGLVTRETSLIVLDRVEDYVRYEITPPKDLREEYNRQMESKASAKLKSESQHLDEIASRFQGKVKWWETDYPKGDKPKPQQVAAAPRSSGSILDDSSERRMTEARPTPVPMPAPMPAMAAPVRIEGNTRINAAQHNAAAVAVGQSNEAKNFGGAVKSMLSAKKAMAPGAPAASFEPAAAAIQLKKWQPDAPYAKRMREASDDDRYAIYLDERPAWTASTAFYLDAADIFFEHKQDELGLRVLSNLAEMNLENRAILRILGYRLMQAKAPKLAIPVFQKVARLAPDEPQSFRDLGLAYAEAGEYQKAIDNLWQVVSRKWDFRFPDIELIALAELNAIVAAHPGLDTSAMDRRLLKNLPLDLRVTLAWDADNTDIDLWVLDPNQEKSYYGYRLSYQGGRMSNDFTGGYGPEEYSLKEAKPGHYTVKAHFYGNRQQIVAGATTLMMKLSTGFGTAAQKDQSVILRLGSRGDDVLVGEFDVAGPDGASATPSANKPQLVAPVE